MNSKQRRTLEKIFEKPTRADISWNEFKSLLIALNAVVIEGKGSRISFAIETNVLNRHKPHPAKELKKYSVEAVRDFLINQNIEP